MAAGFLSRVVPVHRAAVLAVLLALGGPWPGGAWAATTTITGPWAGGTILPADAVVLANGASVTGNVIANGTLQFAQTGSLTIGTQLSGTGTLALANTGTLTLSRITSGTTATLLDMTTNVPQGTLVLGTNATNDLALGVSRSSTLTVGGGVVRNAAAYVGSIPPSSFSSPVGAVGGVTVTGGTWANGGDLFLGASGTGTLTVSGGYVSLVSATLAPSFSAYFYSRPNGAITVSGGTVAASGNVRVGASGTGRLTIGGGVMTVGGTLSTGTSGTVALNAGGTLRIGTGGTTGELAATFPVNGTLVFDRGGTTSFAGDLGGTGSVNKAGPGLVVLAGSNALAGPTSVTAGTLQLTKRVGLNGGDPSQWTAATFAVSDKATLAFNVGGTGELRATNVTALAAIGTGSGGFMNGSSFGLDTTNAPGGVFAYAGSLANPNLGSNALGLVKLGTGTLALSGSNTFTGPTAIRAGTALYTRRAALYGGDAAQFTAARLTTTSGGMLAVAVGGTDGFTSSDVDVIAAIGTGSTGFLNGSWLGLDTSTAVGGTFTYASPIYDTNGETNALGVAKLGTGTLVLAAASDYSGGTLIAGGGLVLAVPQAISATGPVTVASGSLVLGGGSLRIGTLAGSSDGIIVPAAAGSLTLSSSSVANSTFAGSLQDGPGTLAFTKLGSGTLTLSGSNGFTGPTAIQGGAIQFATRTSAYGGDPAKWTAANLRTGTGAMLAVNVGGVGEFTAADVDILASLGTPSAGFANGSTLGLDTTNTVGGTFAYASSIANPNGGANVLKLAKYGPGTLAVSGSNTFTGGVELAGGVLSLGSATPLGSAGLVTFSGGTLQYTSANAVDYSSRFSAAARQAYAIDTNGRDVTFATGLTSGTGTLTKTGAGALTLTASNSYSGGTTVLGGTLAVPTGGAVVHPSANLLVEATGSPATLDVVGGRVSVSSADFGTRPGTAGTARVVSGTFAAASFLTVGGTGTGLLTATNAAISCSSFSAADAAGSTATVSLVGSRLDATGFLTVGNWGTASMTVVSSTLTSTFGDISFASSSSGTLALTNSVWNNSWDIDVGGSGFGTVVMNGGAVTARDTELDGSSSQGGGSVLVTAGTWTSTRTLTIGDSGTGTLTITGGLVSGSTAVIGDFFSRANGTVTVTGGTFSTLGNLTVGASGTGRLAVGSGGLVTVGGTLSRGTFGTIVVDPGGTLQVGNGGTGGVLATNVATNGTLAFNLSGSSSASAVISGSGGLAKLGSGTLTLSGSNTYAGGTQILGGRLIGTVGTIRGPIANAAALTFAQTVDGTFASAISGTGSLTKTGGGTLTLAAASSLSGPVTVQQGGLRLGQAGSLAAATLTPLAGGTVSLAPRLQATVGGLAATAGGLVDVGNGAMTVASGLATATMLQALGTGRGDGTWSGTAGIVSSVARADLTRNVPRTVGWLDNGDGSKTFAYAAPGDTNLDWQVDILDAANFLAGGKFDTWSPASWNEGDFGYDGIVDILDAADFLSTGLFDAGGYNGSGVAGVAAVPEPTVPGIAVLAAGVVGLAVRCVRHPRRRSDVSRPAP
jgi:autotransporter-associated beta strand protein/T5SS/PEP-CTERM-associated repeat protein